MKTTITVLAATVMVSAIAAFADDAALKALDPDKDGTVSLAEAQAGASKVFGSLNKDKDGTLDAKELGDRIDAAGIKAADPDNDGTLDAKEYAKIVESKFKAADPWRRYSRCKGTELACWCRVAQACPVAATERPRCPILSRPFMAIPVNGVLQALNASLSSGDQIIKSTYRFHRSHLSEQ
jgi:hypothetical protein